MASANCRGCGRRVSDKTERCADCGTVLPYLPDFVCQKVQKEAERVEAVPAKPVPVEPAREEPASRPALVKCRNCSNKVSVDALRCPRCGIYLPDVGLSKEQTDFRCVVCGGSVRNPDKSCPHCGDLNPVPDEKKKRIEALVWQIPLAIVIMIPH
jgi:hypothetical protein